ncbi:MAG: 2-oxoglutarate dehydrogenase E1 component [Gemmatimonadetes bacterium]|uniref:oxoglutarate dehydrogenase (succinyl-transferring) n=1 Tax=Candidatus Kutchimonas denitrificans TaxID=3056748 RepID=A0AAE4Z8G1_9BACT|nr:2-oxoglutarate dehydrogenase E1 component [Gemmatimonadota bacterium]NIR74592.1 2-oxoglutarate dehydrogenase E1 component [Candidatus Kutchimonas denitrificans]NIS02782.1 2-oxoglutarate dehydrogenase E1 component [Gemmatimonadota bacterium]NIT68943.1 2-oxoglutarate dehydrogenase E1 component [Gemmatimonadota bacterium]NIU52248.1 2-oxoglutarate dehydrogenase E1 component [Gemmatimonadota bacterium]
MSNHSPTSDPRARAVAELYRDFARDAASVDPGWREVFSRLDDEAAGWLKTLDGDRRAPAERPPSRTEAAPPGLEDDSQRAALDSVRALMMIRAYRVRGHLEANLDPLNLAPEESHPELDPETYGFTEADMDRPIYLHGVLGLDTATLREIHGVLRRDYCRTIGLEFMHLQDPEEKAWIQLRMEGVMHRTHMKPEAQREVLERLTEAEIFEKFLNRKYTGTKRFSLEGAEAAVPALETILQRGAELDLHEIVLGMAHRGRINVLANVMQKPLRAIFHEFQGGAATPEEIGGSGDVKYHLGTSTDRQIMGRSVHLSLVPNPSHLEAVDPVVLGKVRSSQDQRDDVNRCHVMGILIHGDAAFAAQGVAAETLQLGELDGYTSGGVIHLIINNQIGFTTNPMAARSSPYPSDLAKAIQAPIVHVNGDDPDAVVQAALFAIDFRQVFKRDVVIDMYCYRRHGHNEGDEPAFTQPRMYREIKDHPTVRRIYAEKLVADDVVTEDEVEELIAGYEKRLEDEFQAAEDYRPKKADWLEGAWSGIEPADDLDFNPCKTDVALETLQEVGRALTTVPDEFNINRKLVRQLKTKRKMFSEDEPFDWATGEALAFGTLLLEDHPVRLSGEDSNRGTFSQRHATWVDQETEEPYVPLNHIRDGQSRFEVVDSPLSEFGALGFEYGYAMDEPRALVLWEAQFGDFANGAQVIIDQFIAAGEAKWLRMCGLVMLLPHGYEGQGPEHSSARLERFLQLSAQQNLQVVNPTTPANYFHVLRRQLHRRFRKPLIVMTPKSLLRHKRAVSRLAEFGPDSCFEQVKPCEELPSEAADARQLVLCSGKVYYDLLEEREKRETKDVHILRLEQLYPFPEAVLERALEPYKHCRLVWCQEEPHNMGAWTFVVHRLLRAAEKVGFEDPVPRYVGRAEAASPATGLYRRHVEEQERLVDAALSVGGGGTAGAPKREAAADGGGDGRKTESSGKSKQRRSRSDAKAKSSGKGKRSRQKKAKKGSGS